VWFLALNTMIITTRKCGLCKENIELEKEKKTVLQSKKYYHYDCFIEKEINKKRNVLTKEEIENLASQLIEENKNFINEIINKNHLYLWLQKKYNLTMIPTYIYQKLADIYNGTWKDINIKIPPEDILDMFKRQWHNLEQIHISNINKGKKLSPENRLNYDLSVIINKSSSYYEWRKKQEEQQIEMMQSIESSQATNNFRSSMGIEQNVTSNENDLSQYLEEI